MAGRDRGAESGGLGDRNGRSAQEIGGHRPLAEKNRTKLELDA